MKKPRKPKNKQKIHLAKFNFEGKALCPFCHHWLAPYMWVRGDGSDNIFKCDCKKVIRVVYVKGTKL